MSETSVQTRSETINLNSFVCKRWRGTDRKYPAFGILVLLLLLTPLRSQAIEESTPENVLSVTYRPQENTYFCGPAVVQMALSYLSPAFPSQDQLATEMETDPEEGVTYSDMVQIPLKNRGFTRVYYGTLEPKDLKEASNSGFLAIILIYFDTTGDFQHYVLVIGYNSSGIHVHDPWPTTSSSPKDRRTGANAFISNELLTDLWSCDPSNWGLIIPYSTGTQTTLPWGQQYWYLLIIIPVSAIAILVVARFKKKQSKEGATPATNFINYGKLDVITLMNQSWRHPPHLPLFLVCT